MKRWASGALALIITLSFAGGSLASVSDIEALEAAAVQVEVQTEAAEPASEDETFVAPAVEASGADVLPDPVEQEAILGNDDPEATPEPEANGSVDPAATAAQRYARIAAAAELRPTPDGAAIATIDAGSAVLVLGPDAEDWTRIALYTERGIVTGCVAAGNLNALDDHETRNYLDALAADAAVALYEDNIDTPLELAGCAFIEAEPTAQDDPTPEPENESTPEPEADPVVDPDPEAEPAAESEEAPVEPEAEPTAEPADAPEMAEDVEEAVAAPAEEAGEAQAAEPEDAVEIAFEDEVRSLAAAQSAEILETAAMASFQVNQSSLKIGLKESYTGLSVTGGGTGVTWSSSDSKIVKVDASTGAIKGLKKGSATITATSASGSKATCKVKVVNAPKNIKITPAKLSMSAGGMKTALTVKLSKGSASAGTTFTSKNTKVATVDSNGVVTAKAAGTTVITARTFNKKKATCKVKVYAAPASIKMPSEYSIAVGQKSTLDATAYAANGSKTVAGLTFTIASNSPNPKCVSVDNDNGQIVGVSKGTVYINVTTHNGHSCGPCKVTVAAAPKAIKLSSKLSIGVKESRTMSYKLTAPSGESACAAAITWSSTNKKVVKVDPATGAIKGLKKGSATIVAKTHNGLKAKCKVTVKKAPGKVTIKPSTSVIKIGSTLQYTAKLPKGTAGGYTFTSSDPKVATINESGLATGVAVGQTVITVKTFNGKTAKAKLTVSKSSTDTSSKSSVEVPASMEKLGIASYQNVYSSKLTNEEKLEYVIYNAQTQLGKPYVYGKGYKTANPTGFDCSGFTYWCFYKLGIQLGESAYKQGYDSRYTKIVGIENLKRGDVVCFNTVSDSDLSDHTGIYLGNGYFIHASSGSSKRKVLVQRMYNDSISGNYYKRNFSWGRRILK